MVEFYQEIINSRLLIQEVIHGLFALPFAFFLWKKTKSVKKALLVIIITYLLDLDHLVDYFAYFGFRFNLFEFLSAEYFQATKRAIVPLHGWEWVFILLVLSIKRGWRSYFTLFLFALVPHLIYDSIAVGSVVFYSIIYRAVNGFTNFN